MASTDAAINIVSYQHLVTNNNWTNAIRQAILDSPWGGMIIFPEGTYNHEGIVITKPINIRGRGKYSTILKNTSTNPAITINSNVERGTIRDIAIFGNGTGPYGANATSGKGIVFNNNSVCWNLDNIWMRSHGDWFIYADGNGHVNNINLTNSELEWGKKGAIHLIQINPSNQINVINIGNCNFSYFMENGLELWGQSITVQNCAIQACKKYGISIDGSISPLGQGHAQAVRIDNNYFELCNNGFLFLKAIVNPFPRYIFGVSVTNCYGVYTPIPGDTVNASNVSIVEVQAPHFYSYSNLQVSGFTYDSNVFSSGISIKAILNANDVLSYDSKIQRGNTTSPSVISLFKGLGRARVIDGLSEKYVIKGISNCVTNQYTLEKSSNITANTDLVFDLRNYSMGNVVGIEIPIDTDCTNYTVELIKKYRSAGSMGLYTDYVVSRYKNLSGSRTISNEFGGAISLLEDYYVVIRIIFNAGNTKTRFYVGNPVFQFFN